MKEITKTIILVTAIIFFSAILFLGLTWSGYSSGLTESLRPYTEIVTQTLTPTDLEVQSLQEREMELISEIENQKILEAIKEEQKVLEEKAQELSERESNIQALTTALEEEKNNFLRSQELAQQKEKEKENYQQRVSELATTFISMPPERAVERILALDDDLLIIDILKKIDNTASEVGQISITPLYYSLMDEKDASRILKKSTVTF